MTRVVAFLCIFTGFIHIMKTRTNIELDDQLLEKAKKYTVKKTKKAVVEEALEFYIKMHNQADLMKLFGKVEWEGNLEQSRK